MLANPIKLLALAGMLFASLSSCAGPQKQIPEYMDKIPNKDSNTDTAVFGGGCFWCVEAIYVELKGVISVTSGYSGGSIENPGYRQVCSGSTGHAEVCEILYDPTIISFDKLLEVFWTVHDPTQLNRQGNDVGTQYRSIIFYTNTSQRELAESYKEKLNAEKTFNKPVVTEISPLKAFYKAEDYHQDYFEKNGNAPYCSVVIVPKVEKFRKVFGNLLR